MLRVFNFTSVKFLNDDYDLVSRNYVCAYLYFSNERMKKKKFDVVLRSCNKQ